MIGLSEKEKKIGPADAHAHGMTFSNTDWSGVPQTEHSGETGKAFRKVIDKGTVRLRLVEYTAGYRSDHWCRRGHALQVLEGRLAAEFQNGETRVLEHGKSYQVADNTSPHRFYTEKGAKLYILDLDD